MRVLRRHDAASIIRNLEAGVAAYRAAVDAAPRDRDATKRVCRRLRALRTSLHATSRALYRIDHDPWVGGLSELGASKRAALRSVLADCVEFVNEDLRLRKGTSGPKSGPRMLLNVSVARALQTGHVPLTKGRMVADVYALVYYELKLPARDVFRNIDQGVTLATQGIRWSALPDDLARLQARGVSTAQIRHARRREQRT